MKKDYLKPEAKYLELCADEDLAQVDAEMSGVWGEEEVPEDW